MENLELLTVKDIAKMLNLSKYAIYNMVANNSIPYIRVGKTNRSVRFDKNKIIAWINKNSYDNTVKS